MLSRSKNDLRLKQIRELREKLAKTKDLYDRAMLEEEIARLSTVVDPLARFHAREAKKKRETALKNLRKMKKVNDLTKKARDQQNKKLSLA